MPETPTPATEPATPADPSAAAAPTTEPTWEELFKNESPAEVKAKLEHSRKWETRAKENDAWRKANEAKVRSFDVLEQASKTDLERAAEEAQRWQSDSERWRQAALSSRVQALAADFVDPSDAIGALTDTSKYLTASGEIDDAAIQTDLQAVLQSKPHWRRQDGPRPPAPNPAQGAQRGGPTEPRDQFAAVLQNLTR